MASGDNPGSFNSLLSSILNPPNQNFDFGTNINNALANYQINDHSSTIASDFTVISRNTTKTHKSEYVEEENTGGALGKRKDTYDFHHISSNKRSNAEVPKPTHFANYDALSSQISNTGITNNIKNVPRNASEWRPRFDFSQNRSIPTAIPETTQWNFGNSTTPKNVMLSTDPDWHNSYSRSSVPINSSESAPRFDLSQNRSIPTASPERTQWNFGNSTTPKNVMLSTDSDWRNSYLRSSVPRNPSESRPCFDFSQNPSIPTASSSKHVPQKTRTKSDEYFEQLLSQTCFYRKSTESTKSTADLTFDDVLLRYGGIVKEKPIDTAFEPSSQQGDNSSSNKVKPYSRDLTDFDIDSIVSLYNTQFTQNETEEAIQSEPRSQEVVETQVLIEVPREIVQNQSMIDVQIVTPENLILSETRSQIIVHQNALEVDDSHGNTTAETETPNCMDLECSDNDDQRSLQDDFMDIENMPIDIIVEKLSPSIDVVEHEMDWVLPSSIENLISQNGFFEPQTQTEPTEIQTHDSGKAVNAKTVETQTSPRCSKNVVSRVQSSQQSESVIRSYNYLNKSLRKKIQMITKPKDQRLQMPEKFPNLLMLLNPKVTTVDKLININNIATDLWHKTAMNQINQYPSCNKLIKEFPVKLENPNKAYENVKQKVTLYQRGSVQIFRIETKRTRVAQKNFSFDELMDHFTQSSMNTDVYEESPEFTPEPIANIAAYTEYDELKIDKNLLLASIWELFQKVFQAFDQQQYPAFETPNLKNYKSFIMKEGRLSVNPTEMQVRRIRFYMRNSRPRFCHILYILGKMKKLLEENIKITHRELYYQCRCAIKRQDTLSNCLIDISQIMNVGPWDLNIISQCGLVCGSLKIYLVSKEIIDCNSNTSLMCFDLDDIFELETQAKFILVVEKESIFRKLQNEEIESRIEAPFIMITGKGFPDLNTQRFLKKIAHILNLPVFILTDADPDGLKIMLTYKFGSLAHAHVSNQLAVPKAQWMGVLPSEIISFGITESPLTERELRLAKKLTSHPCVNAHQQIMDELQVFLKRNRKASIEGLIKSHHFLSGGYIKSKVQIVS